MPTRFLEHDEQVPGLDQTTILDFWRWAYSDVQSNGTRSVFAEFMVGKALGCWGQPRVESGTRWTYITANVESKSKLPPLVNDGFSRSHPASRPASLKHVSGMRQRPNTKVRQLAPHIVTFFVAIPNRIGRRRTY